MLDKKNEHDKIKRLGEQIMLAGTIKAGDIIGIISPSHVAEKERYSRFFNTINSIGFNVKEGKNLYKNTHVYLASKQERADDFNEMILDDEVKMVLFGGGNGGNDLLPYINYENIKKHPKIICSYSDGTSILNAIYNKTGLIVYYGQFPGIFGDLRYYDYTQFISNFVNGPVKQFSPNRKIKIIVSGKCDGILIGGYTVNTALLMGSKYFCYNDSNKYILLLEDYEKFSKPEHIHAYISHIEQSDFIKNVSGLIFGHYSENEYPELNQFLERFGKRYKIPVIMSDDIGHGINHAVFPIGCHVEIDTNYETIKFVSYI
ncbi:MAG: LD-carboxypeptidase [Treponema sp.]|nr:LD-carboxypeptidase [Treponema sp.]